MSQCELMPMPAPSVMPVSYTHLDVYKRQGDFLFPLPKNISIDLCDLKRGFLYLKAPCGGFFQKPACDLFAVAQRRAFLGSAVPFYRIDHGFKTVCGKPEKGFRDWLGSDKFPVFRLTGLPI